MVLKKYRKKLDIIMSHNKETISIKIGLSIRPVCDDFL